MTMGPEDLSQPPSADADPGQPAQEQFDDPRLLRTVREYQQALEAGRRPNRSELLTRHPDLAEALAECLDGLDLLHSVGPRVEGNGPSPRVSAPGPVELGTPLGDFRILREIGRGGMGVVYEAEQLSLGRRIALKVLPFALTLDSRQLQRFKTEARAAAQLHHSNIVPIYSVGCERGVHFYAMQLIDGQTLAALITDLRRQKGLDASALPGSGTARRLQSAGAASKSGPAASFSTIPAPAAETVSNPQAALSTEVDRGLKGFFRRVAELGVQAAEALEHAHRVGIVHRDVKPGNLLVDGNGQLWVTDFGLAQLQSDAALTLTGDLVGTLRYMSPEQALGQRPLVDHRTDVYSLGATLYELLTLEPAFRSSDRHELLRQIAVDEPPPPRRLNRAIPFDLETVVLKAMAKRPEDRYASAQDLADDLCCFLDSKPLRARRPTPWERMAKWSRRHLTVMMSALVLLVLTAVGLGISTFLVAREQAKTQKAYDELAQEEMRTKEALRNEARSRAAAEKDFHEAHKMLDFVSQVSEEELAAIPQAQEVRGKLLREALLYYQRFMQRHGEDASSEELARFANLLNEMGEQAKAVAVLEKAGQIRKRLFLLEQPSVQKELGLTPEQVEEVASLAQQRKEAYQNRTADWKTWHKKHNELTIEENTFLEHLPGRQAHRLKQIAWQQSGVFALREAEVVQELHLTAEQQREIGRLLEEEHLKWRDASRRQGDQSGPDRKLPTGVAAIREQILDVLTPEQKSRWKEMLGMRFEGEIRSPFGMKRHPGSPPKNP
jgi:serine/threonine protein kinase